MTRSPRTPAERPALRGSAARRLPRTPSAACQRAALHRPGHWHHAAPDEVPWIVRRWLRGHPQTQTSCAPMPSRPPPEGPMTFRPCSDARADKTDLHAYDGDRPKVEPPHRTADIAPRPQPGILTQRDWCSRARAPCRLCAGRRWETLVVGNAQTFRSALPQPSPANRAQARRPTVGVRAPVCGLGMASDGLANSLAVGQYLGRADSGRGRVAEFSGCPSQSADDLGVLGPPGPIHFTYVYISCTLGGMRFPR
jgi:hypothetical protein